MFAQKIRGKKAENKIAQIAFLSLDSAVYSSSTKEKIINQKTNLIILEQKWENRREDWQLDCLSQVLVQMPSLFYRENKERKNTTKKKIKN